MARYGLARDNVILLALGAMSRGYLSMFSDMSNFKVRTFDKRGKPGTLSRPIAEAATERVGSRDLKISLGPSRG